MIARKIFKPTSPNYYHHKYARRHITKIRFTNEESDMILRELERNRYVYKDGNYVFQNKRRKI